MSVSVTEMFTEHTVTVVDSEPVAPVAPAGPVVDSRRVSLDPGVDEGPSRPGTTASPSPVRWTRPARCSRSCCRSSRRWASWCWSPRSSAWSAPAELHVSDPSIRHVPVLLERCVALLAPAITDAGRGARRRDRSGWAGTARRSCARSRRCGSSGSTATARRWQLAGERLAPYADRVTLVHAVYDRLPEVLADLGVRARAGRPVRPRRLQPAARRGRPRLRVRAGRPAGHADGPEHRPDRGRRAQHLRRPRDLARVLREYGEERFARRIADRVVASAAGGPFTVGAGWSTWSVTRSRPRPGAPAATRPSARSRPCASRSTASSTCSSGRCPAAVDALAVGGRIVVLSYQSLEDRIVKRALAPAAATTAPADLPVVPDDHQPHLRLLTRGAETAPTSRGRDQPARARRCGCAPPSACGSPRERASAGRRPRRAGAHAGRARQGPSHGAGRRRHPAAGWSRLRAPGVVAVRRGPARRGCWRRAARAAASTPSSRRARSRPPT